MPKAEKIALNWLQKGRVGLKGLSRPSWRRSTENYVISSDVIRFEVRIYGAEGLFQIIKLSSEDNIESWRNIFLELVFFLLFIGHLFVWMKKTSGVHF